jgi:Zn finger protein HypA/HybF involved in hydrogenase expression
MVAALLFNMADHLTIAEERASSFQTDPTLKEVKCGGRYVVLDEDGNYCPNCGERLKG